jgi:membrane fusion protein, multidrug efflux system
MKRNSATDAPLVKRLARCWPLAGWLAAAIAVVGTSGAIVMARTDAVGVERSRLAAAAARGPQVLVERARAGVGKRRISLPATIVGYSETPIYAKISGYLKEIRVDKGDRVRQGQILAILSSPELDEQVADARHNLWLQQVTDRRDQGLLRTHAVSQQIADNSHAAMLQAADTYRQLRAMQSYEVISAPYDGIVTARYVDPGALIAQTTTPAQSTLLSHTSETATPIATLATLRPLRVYASIPQNVANLVHAGNSATVTVEQYPAKSFSAPVTRCSRALDPATRMMLVEVDLPNSEGVLYPGMFGTMSLTVKGSSSSAPVISDDALIFRNGEVLAPVIRNSIVHLMPVTLGYFRRRRNRTQPGAIGCQRPARTAVLSEQATMTTREALALGLATIPISHRSCSLASRYGIGCGPGRGAAPQIAFAHDGRRGVAMRDSLP